MEFVDTNMYYNRKNNTYILYSYYKIEPEQLMFPVEVFETIQKEYQEQTVPDESVQTDDYNKSSVIEYYKWPKDILNLSTRELNKYISKNNLSTQQIASLKLTRRRMKNCIYSRNCRNKKKV